MEPHQVAIAFADAVVARLHALVDDRLVAAYVVGSLATGDAVPGHSDVDMLVVVRGALDGPARRELADAVVDECRSCPWSGLELVVYSAEVLRRPGYPVRYELNVNAGRGRSPHVSTHGDPPHWFLIDVAMARQHALPRLGPPAAEVIGEPPVRDVLAAVRDSLEWHRRNERASANTVLNACRSWHFAVTSTWESKATAARWALRQGADDALVRAALAGRAAGDDEGLDRVAVSRLLSRVAAEVAAAIPA